jgi:imidazoleglycerol-phosphate dehydratase
LDGTGIYEAKAPIGFFEHMLAQVSLHGYLDITIVAKGDTHVDGHHLVEDTGIAFGKALAEALGDKKGIRRYGSATIPMDEVLVMCAIDLSGRPHLHFDAAFTQERLGDMDTELFREFFQALCLHGGLNLHIKVLHGENNHHIAEAIFKAFGRALSEAVGLDARVSGIPSTKGSI